MKSQTNFSIAENIRFIRFLLKKIYKWLLLNSQMDIEIRFSNQTNIDTQFLKRSNASVLIENFRAAFHNLNSKELS